MQRLLMGPAREVFFRSHCSPFPLCFCSDLIAVRWLVCAETLALCHFGSNQRDVDVSLPKRVGVCLFRIASVLPDVRDGLCLVAFWASMASFVAVSSMYLSFQGERHRSPVLFGFNSTAPLL